MEDHASQQPGIRPGQSVLIPPALLPQVVDGNRKWGPEEPPLPPRAPQLSGRSPASPLCFQFLSRFQVRDTTAPSLPRAVFGLKIVHPLVKFCQKCFESVCGGALMLPQASLVISTRRPLAVGPGCGWPRASPVPCQAPAPQRLCCDPHSGHKTLLLHSACIWGRLGCFISGTELFLSSPQ